MSIPFYGGSLDPNQYNPSSPSARAAKEKKPKTKTAKTKTAKTKAAKTKAAPTAPDPVATLPDASYSEGGIPLLPADAPDSLNTPPPESKPEQPTGPVSLAGGLAVGTEAPNADMKKLAASRGGRPYTFAEPTGPQKVTEVVPVGSEADTGEGYKFPMSKEQFNALSTQQRMEASMELAKLGADRSKMILPTQADVNLYQSRHVAARGESDGPFVGAPEYRLKLGDKPRNYVDSARPNAGRWIDPQTGDQYNVNEYSGRQLRQRMPHLVRPEEMDRMMGAGIAPEFMGAKSSRVDVKTGDPRSPDEGYEGLEGPELDAYKAARERLQKQGDRWKPKEGVVEQLDEEAKTAAVMPPVDPREAPLGVDPVTGDPIVPKPRVGSRPLGVLAGEHAASIPPETVMQLQHGPADLARAGMAPDPAKFFDSQGPVEDTGAWGMHTADAPLSVSDDGFRAGVQPGIERVFSDVPDAAELYVDPRLGDKPAPPPAPVPRAEEDAPEVDIPVDDEPDEGYDVELDPEDMKSFREAVESGLVPPVATPELSDVDLTPFVEAIFGEGAEATAEVIARVRKILAEHKGKTPAQIKAIFEMRDPLK